jgi:cytoskeletal protein CcmA (bactofilin family)
MFSKKEIEAPGSKTLTIIAEGVKIEGKIYSKGSTRIDGCVIGEIISEKEFTIGKEGKVEANVRTCNAVIAGSFKGEMISSGEVEITATGKFLGNLTQKDALFTIAKGGLFTGESVISENPDIFKISESGNPKDSISVDQINSGSDIEV